MLYLMVLGPFFTKKTGGGFKIEIIMEKEIKKLKYTHVTFIHLLFSLRFMHLNSTNNFQNCSEWKHRRSI